MPRALTGITNFAPQVSGFSKVARREVEYHRELFKVEIAKGNQRASTCKREALYPI